MNGQLFDVHPGFGDRLVFSGPSYDPRHDQKRLSGQIERVYEAMRDEQWRTLGEISELTGDPQASISAQLRHLRKPRFGGYTVDKRRRGRSSSGLWEYRLVTGGDS